MNIKALAEQYNDYIIERRRFYHTCPELSGEEKNTRAELKKDLEALGITDIREMKGCYGMVATIHGGKPGKTVALRSDIDALPVKEETGLTLKRFRARGLLTFIWGNMTEFIHLYTADRWEGEMVRGSACREGVLEWVPKEKVTGLPIWEGDKIFFRLLAEDAPFFLLKLRYEGDTLVEAALNGAPVAL